MLTVKYREQIPYIRRVKTISYLKCLHGIIIINRIWPGKTILSGCPGPA